MCCQADTVAVLLERMIPELEDLKFHGIFDEVRARMWPCRHPAHAPPVAFTAHDRVINCTG
jgi:hypothetical protein